MLELFIFLVGDSDIERWPSTLLPDINSCILSHNNNNCQSDHDDRTKPSLIHANVAFFKKIGQAGSLLEQMPTQIHSAIKELMTIQTEKVPIIIFVACAGENDYSSGYPIDHIINSMEITLKECLTYESTQNTQIYNTNNFVDNHNTKNFIHDSKSLSRHVLFLGPKFEPWLEDDLTSRKGYTKLSKGLQRCCNRHTDDHNKSIVPEKGNMIHNSVKYIDCLTMFCGESKNIPGALHGGKAIPQKEFFHADGLHLSDYGYRVWKDVVESAIMEIIISYETPRII